MSHTLQVLLLTQPGAGWGPVRELAQLAARLAAEPLRKLPVATPPSASCLATSALISSSMAPLTRFERSDLLVIAPVPGALLEVVRRPWMRAQHRRIYAWVIDSFWTERISASLRLPGLFTHVYITDPDDLDEWKRRVASSVSVLPWGTDALGAYHRRREKDIDLLRVGRQPAPWDDDTRVGALAEARGLTYAGRPRLDGSQRENQDALNLAYSRSRVVLASGNRAAPAPYTHPIKEYVTGRWTDSFANGCLVAGAPPRCGAAELLLPEKFLIRVDPHNVEDGLRSVAEAIRVSPAPWAIQSFALQHLDWRYRIAEIFARAAIGSAQLETELSQLQQLSKGGMGEIH